MAINIKTFDKSINTFQNYFQSTEVVEEIPFTQKPEQIVPPQPALPTPDIIQVVKNNTDIKEIVFQTTETNENVAIQPILKTENIHEIAEDEVVVDDIPFAIIEEAPVFPGCTGTKSEKKDCFNIQITLLVQKNFRGDIAQDLGLTPGTKKIFALFTIDKDGNIANIKIRAPHKSLEAEAERVLKLLPKMIPGKQRNRNVNVSYALPITFKVIE